MFKLFSWNIRQGGGKRINDQINVIAKINPDIVTLQEVTANKVDRFKTALASLGYENIIDSFELASDIYIFKGPRRYGQL